MDVCKSKALQAHHLWCSQDVNLVFFCICLHDPFSHPLWNHSDLKHRITWCSQPYICLALMFLASLHLLCGFLVATENNVFHFQFKQAQSLFWEMSHRLSIRHDAFPWAAAQALSSLLVHVVLFILLYDKYLWVCARDVLLPFVCS